MPTIYLIRHAEPEPWGDSDATRPLSPRGRKQAAWMGKHLAGETVTELRTAPHLRCVQTAEAIAEALDLTPIVDDALHIARDFSVPRLEGTHVWVAHSNNIPGAMVDLGLICKACGHASAWRIDFADSGEVTGATYIEPAVM
jgi:hypothetical protein